MLNSLDRINYWVSGVLSVCVFALSVATVFTMFAGVVSRYFFAAPLFWGDEVTLIFLTWATMLSAPLLVKASQNIAISVFFDLLGRRVRAVIAFVTDLVLITLFLYLLYTSIELSQRMGSASTPALRITEAVYGWAAITGFALMAWFQLRHFIWHFIYLFEEGGAE